MSRKQYVWDSDNDIETIESNDKKSPATASAKSSRASLAKDSKVTKSSGDLERYLDEMVENLSHPATHTPQTIERLPSHQTRENIEEIKDKVTQMQRDLTKKSDESQELHLQLKKLQRLKEHQFEAKRRKHLARLDSVRREGDEALTRQRQLDEKITSDTKHLQDKYEALMSKREQFKGKIIEEVERLRDTNDKKRQRQRRQLALDEKSSHDKALMAKESSLRKQAIESFAPMMDEMVIQHKLSIQRRKDEIESELLALKAKLEAELDSQLTEMERKLRSDSQERERQHEQQLMVEYEASCKRRAEELVSLKEKLSRDRRVLDEKAEALYKSESDHLTVNLQALRDMDGQQTKTMIACHQRELAKITQKYDEELISLHRHLEAEKLNYERECRAKLQNESILKQRQHVHESKMKVNKETGIVLEKVRQDLLDDRRNIQNKLESTIADRRIASQQRIDESQQTLKLSKRKLEEIVKEENSLEICHSKILREYESKQSDLSQISQDCEAIRRDLLRSENHQISVNPIGSNQLDHMKRLRDQQLQSLELEIQRESKKLEDFERQSSNESQSLQQEMALQLDRIREKIDRLLCSKDNIISDLKSQSEKLMKEKERLEYELAHKREEHVLRAATEIDPEITEGANYLHADRSIGRKSNAKNILRRK